MVTPPLVPIVLRIINDESAPQPIPEVSIQIYVENTQTLVTTGITDVNGICSVLVPEASYDVLLYKQGTTFNQPIRLIVLTDDTSPYTIIAHQRLRPESADPKICLVSGYMRNPDGAPSTAKLTLSSQKDIVTSGGEMITPDYIFHVHPSESGYYQFELLRGMKYWGYVVHQFSLLDLVPPVFVICVPDRPSIDIAKLFYPMPATANFGGTDTIDTIIDEGAVSVPVNFLFSDGSIRVTDDFPRWVSITVQSSDPSVLTVDIKSDAVVITPLQIGAAEIMFTTIIDPRVSFDPPEAFLSETLLVTVA